MRVFKGSLSRLYQIEVALVLLLCRFFKLCAREVAAFVILPALQTDPAELMLALLALHVVAAIVLLYRLFAMRARLCVLHDPGSVFVLLTCLYFPLSEALTGIWEVDFLAAAEAIGLSALADDLGGTTLHGRDCHAVAVGPWAPTCLATAVSV